MNCIDFLHGRWIFKTRVARLSTLLASIIPRRAAVLDVGAGDGAIDSQLLDLRPDLQIRGIDVLVRPRTSIRVLAFDGQSIPFADKTFDAVMFIDVLHHTDNAAALIQEAGRVGRSVIIKDHVREGLLAGPTLRLMDFVGNARFGVALPYNYWTRQQWAEVLGAARLAPSAWIDSLKLYAPPLTYLFDRRLHFLASLQSGSN